MSDIGPSSYSKDYEITDAMFGAFRSPGGTAFFWKLFGFATLILSVINLIAIPYFISAYIDFLALAVDLENNPDNIGGFFLGFGAFMGSTFLYAVAYYIIVAILRAAFFRGYFHGDLGDTFPFRFGGDEGRQLLAILGFWGLFLVFMVFTYLVMIIVIGVLAGGAALISGGEPNGAFIVLGVILFILLYIAILCSWIWFGVRLNCAGALTALRQQTHVLAARHVSKNRFWALFGSILVAGIIGYVASYATFILAITMGFVGMTNTDAVTMLTGLDPEATLETLTQAMDSARFKLSTAIAIILVSAGYAFYSLILAGPQAFFTKQWANAQSALQDNV